MSRYPLHDAPILNVDDYVPGRYARTRVLRQAGFTVIEAGTGHEVFSLIESHKPVLVLLDVNLPDMSGFEVCRQIKGDPRTASLTVLHISASSTQTQHQVYGLDSGADGYIVEPVEPAVLIATVNAHLRARRAEEAVRKATEELRWFSYRVGHDLNEPLRTITSYAQLLKRRMSNQDEETTKYLNFIGDAAVRIRSFMDGLVEYSQATGADSRAGLIDCEAVLTRVIANMAAAITDGGAIVTHDPLPKVSADERLEHVLQNLISNAIKYRRPDVPVEIHVSASQKANKWIFSVQDNGIGIEPEYVNDVFEIFRRLHGQEIPGNGIGLALSRKIIESLDGKIWLESTAGAGSTFYFSLPAV
jgi:two-component system sensor histidine kinase/response regulator